MEKSPSPSLLPIFRSRQQAELLALLLGDPDLEPSVTELADRLEVPYPSVHREIERAELAGVVQSRKIGNTRLVRANRESPYFDGLAAVLTRAFGVPSVVGSALAGLEGVSSAFIYGSWASQFEGEPGRRPVEDIDLLVLGAPDRDELFRRIEPLRDRLGRPVQVTVRDADWLEHGEGSFHDTVVDRPMVRVPLDPSDSTG